MGRPLNQALFLAGCLLLAACGPQRLVQEADRKMALLAYEDAQMLYEQALRHGPDRHASLMAARAASKRNDPVTATAHFQDADDMEALTGLDAYDYGRQMMKLGEYAHAETLLTRAVPGLANKHNAVELIGSCQGFRSFYTDSARWKVEPLPLPGLTTAFSSIPYRNGLLFTGAAADPSGSNDPWNGLTFLDLYFASLLPNGQSGQWVPLPGEVNGPFHEGPAALSSDERTLWFTRNNSEGNKLLKDSAHISNLKLFRATANEAGDWGDVHPFAWNNDQWSVGQPALSADGKTLYYASDMPGGHGGMDLWASTDLGTGWGPPQNLGPTINTGGDELFPTVVGRSLYFSSTGHENMGGLDIFETHPEGPWWSEPQNMGYPVNTSRDDFGFWLDPSGEKGWLSSSRNGTDGLYTLRVQPPAFAVEGRVRNARTGEVLPGALVTILDLTNNTDTTLVTDAEGRFQMDLKPNTSYQATVNQEGMLNQSRPISTKGMARSTTIQANIDMEELPIQRSIVVQDIHYDYDRWDIRPDAALVLDKLAKVIQDNPRLHFELGAHTDCRGGDTYNLVLSDARAKSAVDYLVRHGVDQERLTARGYGETMPLAGCMNGVPCTEEQYQADRRTEIKVLSEEPLSAPSVP
jgi:peptidoglycan-associated lipoprotein